MVRSVGHRVGWTPFEVGYGCGGHYQRHVWLTGKRVPDRKLFLSACLSQKSLPGGYAGAVRTTVSTRALFTNGLGTCLIK